MNRDACLQAIRDHLQTAYLLTEKKTKREDYGLRLHGKFLTAFAICASLPPCRKTSAAAAMADALPISA